MVVLIFFIRRGNRKLGEYPCIEYRVILRISKKKTILAKNDLTIWSTMGVMFMCL